jgi:hypothetical protein
MRFPASLVLASALLCGCDTSRGRRAEDAAVRSQVSQEISRICALPEPQRQAEIDRIKQEHGMAIVCPNR